MNTQLETADDAILYLAEFCDNLPSDRLIWDRIHVSCTWPTWAARGAGGGIDRAIYSGTPGWNILVTFIEPGQGSAEPVEATGGNLEDAVAETRTMIEKRREDLSRPRTGRKNG